MTSEQPPTYEELERRLAHAEGLLEALRSGRVNTITGENGTLVVRLAEAEARADHIKQVLLAIRNVNQLIVSEDDPLRLIKRACENLTETMGYMNAWIALLDSSGKVVVNGTACTGFDGGFSVMGDQLKNGEYTRCMNRAIECNDIVVVNDPKAECVDCPLSREYVGRTGFSRRLHHGGKTYGILSVSVPSSYARDEEEQSLFCELAGDLAFALHKIEAAVHLREFQQDLQRAQVLTTIGSWRFDLNSRRVIASDETRRIYGLDETEWSIERVQAIPLKQYRNAMDAALRGLVHGGLPYNVEFEILRPSDHAIRHIHSVAEYDKERKIIFGTIQDITELKRAEQAVRARERYLQAILQTSADGFWVIGANRSVIEVNEAYCVMSGYAREEILGMSIGDIDAAEKPDETAARIQRIIVKGSELFETRHRRKDGSVFPVEVSTTWLDEEGGRFICFCRDLTERQRREEHLALLGQLLDAAPASISIHNTQGRFLFANRLTASMHGYRDQAEFMSINLHNLDVPESEALLEERFRRIADQGEAMFEVAHYRKDGSAFPLEVLAKVIEWDGQPAILSVATDITARKRSEQALRESEQRNRLLSDVTMEGIVLHKNGIAMDFNSSMAQMLGFDREELINKNFVEFVHKDDRALVLENIVKEYAPPYTVRMAKKNGAYFFAEIESRNFQEKGNEWRVSAVRDITERITLEAQFRQSQKMESVGRLAGGVAHDFNNMLQAIFGNVAMSLMQITPSSPLRENLEEIQKCAQRSADLTRQLLAFARKQTVAPKVLDLNETVEGMLRMLRRIIGEDIDLAWLPATDLWPVKIDPSQIDQMLANLCVNARDAIHGVGKITLETENVTFNKEYCANHAGFVAGNYISLSVSDNGCGMNKEVQEHLFEPFFTTKETGKGTGLGLATVYGIVKQNLGFINVYSEPGHGTTFKLYVPRHADKKIQNQTEELAQAVVRGHETILMVEDEPTILRIGKTILENLGYTVLAARAPGEAMRLAGEHAGKIDMLMTDVVMPEMNGRDLAKRLLLLYPDIKCLFMSGYTADVIARHGVLDEGVHFIQKPFNVDELARTVRELLESKE